jgi:ribosome biogenesis GTPase A
MLPSLRHSTRAARAATHQRWIERTSAGSTRLLLSPPRWIDGSRRAFSQNESRRESIAPIEAVTELSQPIPTGDAAQRVEWRKLPVVCPGCGAPSQTVESDSAGYYGNKRRKRDAAQLRQKEDDEVFQQALQSGVLGAQSGAVVADAKPTNEDTIPICDRCHGLHHNGVGTSIVHPSMHSIQQIIEESPHKHNHIYHVIDAADFPMSLIPNLQHALDLPRLRTQNRRSKSTRYIRGRVAEVSFIITRSDLLAPQKEQVDKMMHYLQECLRDALGRSGKNVRLGNVRCVSSKRGWWTKNVKEDIYRQGGAAWMVGKANVGKSALFEVVFPKGRGQRRVNSENARRLTTEKPAAIEAEASASADVEVVPIEVEPVDDGEVDPFEGEPSLNVKTVSEESSLDAFDQVEQDSHIAKTASEEQSLDAFGQAEQEVNEQPEKANEEPEEDDDEEDVIFDEDENGSLLPPAQPETAYPQMPLVSSLPGTTASPIRVPFGRGKGELIDLPGIQRSSLDEHILPAHRNDLVMQSRVTPEQHSIKPGQSLLLGGTIRITPKTDNLIFLMYPFVSPALHPHTTATDKAIAIQTGFHPETKEPYAGTVPSFATETAKQSIASAGSFKIQWDVTKRRAGPVTSRSDGKQKVETLPFTVYSADLLIEGVGWVELVAQVRSKPGVPPPSETGSGDDAFGSWSSVPEVEVFSPKGKFVGIRRPLNAWLLGGQLKKPVHEQRPRPRQTVSFAKRKAGGR